MAGRDLTDKDRKAWAAATRHVRPLSGRRAAPERLRPRDELASLQTTAAMRAQKAPPKPQDRSQERRVRRGKQDFSASFDLHGHTQDTAWRALPLFLARQQAGGARCVIVITGKGPSGEGVLRRNFLRWLEMPEARSLVSGYAPAHPKHGGAGAWYVFLRRR
ncbi:MAG: Smr/MutS family protein [Pseudomonadota bacterium]